MIMVPRGSSNRKARQRHPVCPQEFIQMQQHDGKRSKTEVEHENKICLHDLARIHIQTQQKAALKRVKSRVPRRVSMEDDDVFTMFLWTTKTMGLSEKSIDFERETYQKTLRQDSLKKRTPISTGDIFGEEECGHLERTTGICRFLRSKFRRVINPLAASNALRASLLSCSLTTGMEDETYYE